MTHGNGKEDHGNAGSFEDAPDTPLTKNKGEEGVIEGHHGRSLLWPNTAVCHPWYWTPIFMVTA